VVAERGGEGGA
jgi:hypothetical protein